MSSAAEKRKSSPSVNHILIKGEGRKTSTLKPKQEERSGSAERTTQSRPTARSFTPEWRLVLLFGLSVMLFAATFVSIILLVDNAEPLQASKKTTDRVVYVEREAPVELVTVLLPTREIRKGEKLDESMFSPVSRPKLSVPSTAVTSLTQIRGGFAKAIILPGQPVVRELVQGTTSLNPVIASIMPGYRAVTISVTATSSVEGWATAGAFVDVQWVTSDINGVKTAALLTQNAKILSAERQVEQNVPGAVAVPTTVTLLVSERDATKLNLASNSGQIILLLRGMEDANKGSRSEILTLRDLYSNGNNNEALVGGGTLRFKLPNGSYKELALVDGEVVDTTKKPS